MSNNNTQQFISYLLQYDISDRMITILESKRCIILLNFCLSNLWIEQHINDEDLLMMDRDDVEHLFKNEHGFTFRDRKQFWNILQKFVWN